MMSVATWAAAIAWSAAPLQLQLQQQQQCQHHRFRRRAAAPPQLNFLDDYIQDQTAQNPEASGFVDELNLEHIEELRQVAHVRGSQDGVDWSVEELSSVKVDYIDEEGIHLQEILCSATDQRCIAVEVPIPWPAGLSIEKLPDMRRAFSEISRRAYAAALNDANAMPPEYMAQQMELNGLMSLMNSEFERHLRYYALKYAAEALAPTETVEMARLTQITFQGLSLELTTLDMGGYSLELDQTTTRRQVWQTSIIFPNVCASADDVENELIRMVTEDGEADAEAATAAAMPDDGYASSEDCAAEYRAERAPWQRRVVPTDGFRERLLGAPSGYEWGGTY